MLPALLCTIYSTSRTRTKRYDTTSDNWEHISDLPQARGGGACAVVDKKLYFVGGATFVTGKMFTQDHTDMWALDLNNVYVNHTWHILTHMHWVAIAIAKWTQ